jgi:CBS domain-containing protein
MRVADVMTRDVAVVSPQASVREAARRMDRLNVGALPVCDGARLVGIVTDRDITVRCTAAGAPPDRTRVCEVMTDDVRWCFEDDPVEEAEQEMAQVQIRRLPVVDGRKRLVGMLSLGDLATERAPGTGDTLRSISEPSEPDRSDGSFAGARGYRRTESDFRYGSGGYGAQTYGPAYTGQRRRRRPTAMW